MKTCALRFASLLAIGSAALSASAVTVTYDASPFTVMRPDSGFVDVWFTGTITGTNSATQVVGFGNYTGGSTLYVPLGARFSAINAALASTGTYTGQLIGYRFTSGTALGPAGVDTTFFFNDGTRATPRLTVNVVPFAAPSTVPGPAAMAPFAFGALATLRKRRRKARLLAGA